MTAQDLIAGSMRLLGVVASGEPPTATEANDALVSLNGMLDLWSTQSLLIYSRVFETQSLVVNKQSYQMGTGAPDFNTSRPQKIENINWQQVTGTTTLEIPIEIINQDQWAAVSVKTINSNIPTRMWPQYTFPYVTLNFWPIPSVSGNVIIWSWKPLTNIASLTTAISLPPGYLKAIRYNLAVELAPEYGKELSAIIVQQAMDSKADIKRMNTQPQILGCDPSLLSKKSSWNWFTGE